ncbi:MAG TPA: hypothetical protein PK668_13930 [Myxococcota bacterium]|nr:hypothetical protein [Myxococcota bacterium]HRY94038.1 hypothetical protein [Myxococcota bacterium]HSA23411.1 hypothetical protein [Myxococcota bacterium]
MARVIGVCCALALLGAAALVLGGCAGECTKCDADCPSFVGTYSCEFAETADMCTGWYLVTGTHWIDVTRQEGGIIEIDLGGGEDYEGTLCQTEDSAPPRHYAFATGFSREDYDGVRVVYTLAGNLVDQGPDAAATMNGSLTLTILEGSRSCTLVGSFSCQ